MKKQNTNSYLSSGVQLTEKKRKTYDLASHSKEDIDNKVSSFISSTTMSLISSKNTEQYESFTISSLQLLAQW